MCNGLSADHIITTYFVGYIVCVDTSSVVDFIKIYFMGYIVCFDTCSAVYII